MKLCVLVKDPLDVAIAELAQLTKQQVIVSDNIALVNTKRDLSRLAFTRLVADVLFSCKESELIEKAKAFKWDKVYKSDFSVTVAGTSSTRKSLARQLGGIVYDRLKRPEVKLDNTATKIFFIKVNDLFYATRIIWENEEPFEKRKPQFWKSPHPSGMHPKLARAFINLTGIQSGTILDPFCGAGGLIMEAARLNLKPIGYDIDEQMLERARTNLKHYKLQATLKKKDACAMPSANYVVADLPYGKNTKARDLEHLYTDFFKQLKQKLKKTAVIGLPSTVDEKKLVKQADLQIKYQFSIYLHKSLSKTILVLSS